MNTVSINWMKLNSLMVHLHRRSDYQALANAPFFHRKTIAWMLAQISPFDRVPLEFVPAQIAAIEKAISII